MNESEWRPCWIRGGILEEFTWIGKDVLAWTSGFYIIFFNVVQNKVSLRWCSKQSTGEGAKCISGHPNLMLFAFSEKVSNPRILIQSYPSMNKIIELTRGSANGYLAITFTTRDWLVSLGSLPQFSLIIWSWRTGERIISVDTQANNLEGQKLRATYLGKCLIAHLNQETGNVHIWEANTSGKTVLLTDYRIKFPHLVKAHGMDWGYDSGTLLLAITDKRSDVYLCHQDGTNLQRVVITQRCQECVSDQLPEICWYNGGIILKTTFCQIRFYRKTEKNQWRKLWYIKTDYTPYSLRSNSFKTNRLYCHTREGDLLQIYFAEGQDTAVLETRLEYGRKYRFANFLYPWGHHLTVTDETRKLGVIDAHFGKNVAEVNLPFSDGISEHVTHPDYPMAALTSISGEIILLGLINPEAPQVILHYQLQTDCLDLLKFSRCANYVIASQSTTGNCFCIELSHTRPFEVVAQLQAKRQIVDVLLYESLSGYLKLLVLHVSSKQAAIGHQIILYDQPVGQLLFTDPIYMLELGNGFRSLHYSPDSETGFIGTPYLSKQLHVFEMQEWKDVSLLDALNTGHEVRQANIFSDRHWIGTSAMDGRVVIRDKNINSIVVKLMPHHRWDLGSRNVFMGLSGDLIIALGYNGSLVAMKLSKDEEPDSATPENVYRINWDEYTKHRDVILADYGTLDPLISEMLMRTPVNFTVDEGSLKLSWIEWRLQQEVSEEAEGCASNKDVIKKNFNALRYKVTKLLDINENCPEIERLPLSEFDLDKVTREQKMKVARDEREDARLELESNCISMDRVSNWLKTTFWDPQKVKGQSIFSIFGSIEVTNYAFVAEHPHAQEYLRWSQFSKDVISNIMENDSFCPWRVYTDSQLKIELNKQVRLHRSDEKQRIDALLLAAEEDEDKGIDAAEINNQRAMEGMTTYRFIEPSSHFHPQFSVYSFCHMIYDNRNLVQDCMNLRKYFNKLFNDMYGVKEREMTFVQERNERLRYIDSELNIMFGQNIPEVPMEPEWHHKEKPESIIRVMEQEVKAKPYISPSQQEILDRQTMEADRLRLLLLADDFREKALMAMMDGVLEVRWEDIIKKDEPKPQCMLMKEPDEYTAEDILLVQQYESNVEFLQHERERYRRILESDFQKVSGLLKEGIDKFNSRLREFFQTRLKVEAATLQLNLRYVRICLRNFQLLKLFMEDDLIREKIASKQKDLSLIMEHVRILQNSTTELRVNFESFSYREKSIEKKFRSEFHTVGKGLLELLIRQYKRRPYTVPKEILSCDLLEVGKCAATFTKSTLIPQSCIDYVKALDLLDIRPATLPQSIDSGHWDHLVKARRHKIEMEMKIKAIAADILEAEHTIMELNKKITRHKTEIDNLREQLGKLHQDKIDFAQNVETQFVLKMGQVEIQPNGHLRDTRNAIFIPRYEVEKVNQAILNAGDKKLQAMTRTINFHRGILIKEWTHKYFKMKIEDLREELSSIANVNVTRDIQVYLKRKAKNIKDDKIAQQLERELEVMHRIFEKSLKDWLLKMNDVDNKIQTTKRNNSLLDKSITETNVTRCEMELQRNLTAEEEEEECRDGRMKMIVERSELMRKLQENYAELLVMQTEHELLRLRRFPALDCFRTLYDDVNDKRN
ncbi:cilia- and flagella-associated protein 43-like [Cephus cinctus]|uniref:Cilia- and flagella-associated protein 43 n=1 Tax=Cephus cinctus TaxID=211228 RepID=A0AAJ7FNP3_CEPCN|nr:cilia- and flagella-associated protein 43-like [Cephus cinctus]